LLPTLLYFSFYIPAVQKYAVAKTSGYLSQHFNTRITFSTIHFVPVSRVTFDNFCVYDQHNDTLLFSPELTSGVSMYSFSSKVLALRKIILKEPRINFAIDSTRTINFQFIVEKIMERDSGKSGSGFELNVHRIEINNGKFYLKAFDKTNISFGINFKDIELNKLNLTATNFRSKNGIASFRLRQMSGKEKSGFELINFSARTIIDKSNLTFNGAKITTNLTSVNATQIRFNFSKIRDMGIDFINRVNLFIDLNHSSTNSDDIAYFSSKLRNFHFPVEISGKVTGKINSMRGRNLNIKFGNSSYISGNADIDGLPDIHSSFLYLDILKCYSTPGDLERIKLPNSVHGNLHLPEILHKIDYFSYTGKFSGFINDFVAYGTINSNLGSVNSDLSIRPDTSNSFSFKGKIKTTDFNLGYLLNQQKYIGKISMNAMVNGRNSLSNKLTAKMDGEISSFHLKSYNYKNIKINGTISGKTYDGAMTISDPNVDLNFLGKVNLSTSTPEFNFSAEVKRANLFALNIDTTDTASFISFYATADFAGKNIDDLNGEIKLWNSTLRKTGKEIHINDFLLFTKNVNETKRIILRSDLADAEIWGTYQFLELPQTFQWYLKHYLPSLIYRNNAPEKNTLNNFSFEVDFKDTRLLTDFFVPGLYISRDSKLTGDYDPSNSNVSFRLSIPFMNFKGKKLYNIGMDASSTPDNISFTTGCSSLKLNNQLSLDNFTLLAEASNDSIRIINRWNNWDSTSYKGNIHSLISFVPFETRQFPKVKISLAPSQVILHDTLWKINPSVFMIDSNRIAVNHLELLYNNQKIVATGAISKIPDDKLNISCSNVDISVMNPFIKGKNIILGGIVNGDAELSNLYKNPYFHSNIRIDSLQVNHETLGNTEIKAQWNNSDKSIDLSLTALRGNLKTLAVQGVYHTQSKKLDGSIQLDKLKANIFQPFASVLFSDLKGLATGHLEVHGTIKEPVFNGEINAQKVSFFVNYLKTRYSFSKPIKIRDNNIFVNNAVLYDSKGNKCEVDGKITHKYFKNFYFDLNLKGENFEFLNTSEKDNSLFYGRAYASGTVDIFGPPRSLTMNIIAKTEKNSLLAIPLGNRSTDVSEMRFVRFVDKTPKIVVPEYDYEEDQKRKDDYRVNLNGLKLNINLEVTPDATAQIIFDSKIGDMIQGNGYGNIRMEINTQGKFGMYGNFTIESGDYLFTLQNVINKHFKVSQGGTVSWNGNPTDASIDIEAIYPVRASLYDLLFPTMSAVAEDYKSRIPIDCKIFLTGKLMNPEPRFEISLLNPSVQTLVNSAISNQDELNKQFISLLVLGSFLPDQSMAGAGSGSTSSSSGFNPVGSTGMEFISNQLSRWLSQINQDFDIGVNYRPGTDITSQELEVALSTQLLNDRVSINGNFDVGGTSTDNVNPNNTNNIVGDFEVDYKPWKSGKVRFKAFNRSNESYIYELSPYTQGIGITYKEDFNSFGELFKRYWNGVFAKKEEEIKPKAEKESSQIIDQD
jgi:hypothetical protein